MTGEIAGITGILVNHLPKSPGFGWKLKRLLRIVETDRPGCFLACGETTPLPRPRRGELTQVDFLPGGVTAWRKSIFKEFRFSHFFHGYGLGEDKYFSSCVSRRFHLYVSGDLEASHFHISGNRPNHFRMGFFNVYNHYFLMRECSQGRLKTTRFLLYHLIDAGNEIFSSPFRKQPGQTLFYGLGRIAGILKCLLNPPVMGPDDPAWINKNTIANNQLK